MNKIAFERNGFKMRLAEMCDLNDYYEQNYLPLDKDVVRFTGCKDSFSKEEVTSFFEKSLNDKDRYFFLIFDPSGKIIGESVISEIDWNLKKGGFRICIFHNSERGNGIGTWATEMTRDFAFEKLKLHRLELEVYSFNPRAQRTYLKAGFRQEGVLRDAIKDGDNYADVLLMAILESDWKRLKTNVNRN